MALDIDSIAEAMNKAIGATDKDGKPIEVSAEMKAYAKAVVNTLKASTFTHLVGTVTGTTAPGAPLANGAASNGTFLTVPTPVWLAAMTEVFAGPDTAIHAAASTTYLQTASKINFTAGNIIGQCTSTPVAPGPLVNGAGQKGTIDSLTGSDWASLVTPPLGDPSLAADIYDAIIKQIKSDAEAKYNNNTVNGTCPAAGGPLTAGVGIGGIVE